MARPKRGPKGRRVGWSKLTRPYRNRLEAASITRGDWEAGVDLRKLRGHTPAPPPWQYPSEAVSAILGGTATMGDLGSVREWANSKLAPWWTNGLDGDVAAALSQIPFPPDRWADVLLTPSAEGVWSMRVIPKGRLSNGVETDRNGNDHKITAYDAVILIPGGGAPGEGGRQVMDLLTFGPGGDDERAQEWETISFDLMGTT